MRSKTDNDKAIHCLGKLLTLSPDEPGYIIMAVKELWREHCDRVSPTPRGDAMIEIEVIYDVTNDERPYVMRARKDMGPYLQPLGYDMRWPKRAPPDAQAVESFRVQAEAAIREHYDKHGAVLREDL